MLFHLTGAEVHDPLDLGIRHQSHLDPFQIGSARGTEEQVAHSEQFFGAAGIQDHAAVHVGAHAERDLAGQVRLDETGDDVFYL